MKLIKKLDMRLNKNGEQSTRWALFLCSYCKKEVERQHSNGLRYKSCGCISRKLNGKAHVKHGDAINCKKTRLYTTWRSMKQRCYNKKTKQYKHYGGRGITICDEWKDSYLTFKNWALNNGYDNKLTIDRINNNGNYESGNCRFVTIAENTRNTRRTKLNWLTVRLIRALRDEGYKPKELLKIFDINLGNLENVIYDKGWREEVRS